MRARPPRRRCHAPSPSSPARAATTTTRRPARRRRPVEATTTTDGHRRAAVARRRRASATRTSRGSATAATTSSTTTSPRRRPGRRHASTAIADASRPPPTRAARRVQPRPRRARGRRRDRRRRPRDFDRDRRRAARSRRRAASTTARRSRSPSRYGGAPEPVDSERRSGRGRLDRPDGGAAAIVSASRGAATWFPVNDHPSDKAHLHVHRHGADRVDVVANGVARPMHDRRGRRTTTWIYEDRRPDGELPGQVGIGDFELRRTPPDARRRRHRATPSPSLADEAATDVRQAGRDDRSFFAELFGPYPFEAYGAVVVDERARLRARDPDALDLRRATSSTATLAGRSSPTSSPTSGSATP